ncbi:hypothetical protein DQ04_04011030 [Trypanosoma grayi]|uniref:hypothetical protein n=1 Tax=Trypanosoma grayi TaxID=71804 RepID=UPI0004F4370A|nr:hypothetical protein DQ04_04011030 [Trypanosoma grayi]KEG10230.1 hypothetical protein DQ04_04011030 [Trypanosoma grayi]
MFAFLPPAKVARTQRSPLSSTETLSETTPLTAPAVVAANSFTSIGGERVRPTSIADAEIRMGSMTIRPSVFLSGIGAYSCWIVDENTRLLRVWNMRKPFWQRTAPRMAQIPTFTEDEGLPLFVAELDSDEESLAFCTDYGAVSSLDHSVEFRFYSEDDAISVSAFACRREGDAMLTAVGTAAGAVLVAIKVDGERVVADFDRAECRVSVRTSPLSSSMGAWWRAWLPGWAGAGAAAKENSTANNQYCSSGGADSGHEITLLRFRAANATQLWAINAASEVFLLEFGPLHCRHAGDRRVRAKWATNISAMLQHQCRVVAFDESASQLCCLVYMVPCGGHEASLELVMLDTNNGAVRQTLSMQSIGSLAKTVFSSPLQHTKVYLDEARHVVTVLAGHFCVRLNTRVGVRSPCSSEDVHMLRGVERPLGSSLLSDGRIVTIDINGPVESVIRAEGAMIEPTSNISTEQHKSRDACHRSHFTGKREVLADMAQHVNGILQTLHIDAKMSLDSAVLEASEAICSHQVPHEGNWARADLNVEDENMVMHVTHSLVQRQQEHRRFLLTVLLHNEIGPLLQPQTIARLLSMQEALLAMVAIRRLQNDSSYPLSTTTDVEFDVLTPLYRRATATELQQQGAGSSVETYLRLARSSIEREQCQQLLRKAVIQVADRIRCEPTSTPSANARATAAEIVFGEPSHISMLLKVLGEHFCETQRSVLVDHRTKFEEAMAVATIFVLVARAVDESREDMAQFYATPRNVRIMQWTSAELEDYGIQLQVASACTTLSNALAEVVGSSVINNATTIEAASSPAPENAASSAWTVSLADQLRLLDLLAFIIHFSFRNHSQGGPAFYANAMKCTLFREPFLHEPLGYPFGVPRPSTDATLGATVLHLCEELALEFTVSDVLVALCLAEPVEDPLQERRKYEKLGTFCQRNPEMYNIALHALLSQRREWELQLLPELLPEYDAAAVARDTFLMRDAPQLAWLVKPTAFQALVDEGVWSPSYLAYGDDLVTHRSLCLSMAKLAWVAAGAPTSSSYYALRLDDEVVAAQKAHLLPETKNVELGPAEIVQRLLKLQSPDAWVSATLVACLVEEELREDLLTQIVRRAKRHDGEALLKIFHDGASELEVSRALEATATGRILIAAANAQCASYVARVWTNVLDTTEQRLLASWMQVRATGVAA